MKRFAIAFAWLGVLTVCIIVVVLCAPHDHHGVQHQSAHRLVSAPPLRQHVALLTAGSGRIARDAMHAHDRVAHAPFVCELDRGPRVPLLRI